MLTACIGEGKERESVCEREMENRKRDRGRRREIEGRGELETKK